MGVLLNGVRVGEPVIGVDGQPVFWNALYNGVQVWPPAAETLVDVWLKPVDFTSQALYSDHPELKVAAQKVFADGHIEDASLALSTADTTVASINAGTVSFVSDTTNFLTILKRMRSARVTCRLAKAARLWVPSRFSCSPTSPIRLLSAACGAAPKNSTTTSGITPAVWAMMRTSCASSSTVSAKSGAGNGMVGSF